MSLFEVKKSREAKWYGAVITYVKNRIFSHGVWDRILLSLSKRSYNGTSCAVVLGFEQNYNYFHSVYCSIKPLILSIIWI